MIIRKLHPNENGKLDAIQSLAFSFSCDIEKAAEGELEDEVYGAFLDDDQTLTATICTPEFDSFDCYKSFKSVRVALPICLTPCCPRHFQRNFPLSP